MSSNPSNLSPVGGIPEDVMSASESRLRQRKPRRDATKEKIKNKDYRSMDTPERRRARAARVMGDPVAAQEAARVTGPVLESQGVADEMPNFLLERIINGENFLGVRFFDLGQRAARAIARIDIRTPDGRSGSGTGSLVSSRLMLTNNHVLESPDWARRSSAVFDFEDDLENKPRPTVAFQLDPDTFFYTNKEYDFTLVAVQTTALHVGASLSDYGFNPLDDSLGKVTIGEPINIIQHPSGLLKQVVLQENRLLDLPDDPPGWLHYESDTMPGSSGAPLFNNRWEMVGLHHSGWPKRDSQGRILTVDDRIWTRDMGELAIKWLGNEGARVSQILQLVKTEQAAMDAARKALVAELLSPPKTGTVVVPPATDTSIVVSGSTTESARSERKAEAGVQSIGSAGVTLTIPLHITVSLGGSAPATSTPATTARTETEPDGLLTIPTVTAPDDTERSESLRELAEASTKPYFDAAADQAKRTDYYRNTNLGGSVNGNVLYNSLSSLVSSTHQTRLSYKPSRHLYPWVDLQPDRKLRSLYTGDIYEPQQLIEESLMEEAKFEALLESLLLTEGGEGSLSLLEAGPLFNCEHVVPRAWFKGPMFSTAEGDLHHLFTCDGKCNNFRGNVPFWDFVDFNEAVLQGCGRKEENKFEPKQGKGAVARAVMYFLLRYPRLIDNQPGELQKARLQTLLEWHQAEPVSDYERHRNAAIQEKQGNRNPLIDFPELASRVNFSLGLGGGT